MILKRLEILFVRDKGERIGHIELQFNNYGKEGKTNYPYNQWKLEKEFMFNNDKYEKMIRRKNGNKRM